MARAARAGLTPPGASRGAGAATAPPSLRLFVGLRPPAAIRRKLLAAMDDIPGARWQDDDQLHVTLSFLGQVASDRVGAVEAAIASVRAAPLRLAIEGVGRFTRRGRAIAVWAGLAPREPLVALQRQLAHALAAAGFPAEAKPYVPHLTLARLNAASGPTDTFLATRAALASPPFVVDALVLFESRLGRDGARYVPRLRRTLALD